jgi:hypothetical protein
VKSNIAVEQLKREISIEHGLDVTQLKYLTTSEATDANDDDLAISTLQELVDTVSISEYPLQDEIIIVYSGYTLLAWFSMSR